MQVHYGEGVANHIGPAVYRDVCGKALTGERAGQPSSFESISQMPTVSQYREGNMGGVSTVAVPARSGGV